MGVAARSATALQGRAFPSEDKLHLGLYGFIRRSEASRSPAGCARRTTILILVTPPPPGPAAGWSSEPVALLGEDGEQPAGFVEAVAGEQQPLDVLALPGPQLDLEEVAPVRDQGSSVSSRKGLLSFNQPA